MARRFTDDGQRVLLIEADLRRPRLARLLKLQPVSNLEAIIRGEIPLHEAIQEVNGMHCLPAGLVSNPVRLLSSPEFAQFLSACRRQYDFVIIDSPPVLRVIDAVMLARLSQYIIFVVQAARLSMDMVREAISRFPDAEHDKILTLLTRVRKRRLDTRDYFSGYGPPA
jgi:succinoglycan biosynthesis transport protein ExoP